MAEKWRCDIGQTSSEMYIATTTTNDAGYNAITVSNETTSVKSNTVFLLTVTATTAACSSLYGTLYYIVRPRPVIGMTRPVWL